MPQPKAHGFPWDLPTGVRKRWIAVQALTLLYGGDLKCVISIQRYFPALSQLRRTQEITSYLLPVVRSVTWHGEHWPPPLQLVFSLQINFSELGSHEKAFHFFLGGSSLESTQVVGAKSKPHFQTNSARLLLIWKVIEKVASGHFSMIFWDQRVTKVLESPLPAIFKYCVSWTNENKTDDGYSALQIINALQSSPGDSASSLKKWNHHGVKDHFAGICAVNGSRGDLIFDSDDFDDDCFYCCRVEHLHRARRTEQT